MEITRLSWAKPAADLFAPPQNCEQVAGETNATGGHVEMNVGGGARGAAKLVPAKPAQKAAPIPSPAAAPRLGESGALRRRPATSRCAALA